MERKLGILMIISFMLVSGLTGSKKITNKQHKTNSNFPAPKEEDDGEQNDLKRKFYFENMHRAAPGTDWRTIEIQNKIDARNELKRLTSAPANVQGETFANGNVTGQWNERGSNNEAGRMQAIDYLPSANKLYSISAGGTLWMGAMDGSNWTVLNQDFQFSQSALKVFDKTSGGSRILTAAYNIPKYSDDNGSTFQDAAGIDFPIPWGGNHLSSYILLNDAANTVYCLAYVWDPAPWAPRTWLYRSTDQGATYTHIYTFAHDQESQISLCTPNNSTELYALDNNSNSGVSKIFSITGSTVTLLNTTAGLPTNMTCLLKGYRNGASLILYAMTNNDKVFTSVNQGITWKLQSDLPQAAWNKFSVSLNDPAKICFGGVEAFTSADSGVTWNNVNNWGAYYGSPATQLHADIMALEYFKKIDGTEFIICNNDGGTYISYDNLGTNNNIALSGLRVSQYYDILTDPLNPNNIFAGSQDQGFQVNATGNTAGLLNFNQVISGDYGDLCLTNSSTHLWTEYPGGDIYYYDAPMGGLTGTWSMPGTNKPEYGWLLPTANTANNAANEIYMAGGNITGGGGSYLVKITAASPQTFTASQFNYDFMANSNNNTSGISAIGVSMLHDSKIYVATEDGTFFYSNNNGGVWIKSVFTGPLPQYLYGSAILPSKITHNLVWYGGSGYSNPGVYKSTDGGQSFTAMSNGLPNTLVHEIAAAPDESLLFAATEAGPYVYVAADDTWYSLRGVSVPIQDFFTVEYISSISTVRFGTYGRGIFDFQILSALPITLSSFDAQKTSDQEVKLTWTTETEFNNDKFIIQRSGDAIGFKNIATIPSLGNSNNRQLYSAIDSRPFAGKNFYRLMQKDRNGKSSFSKIVLVDFNSMIKPLTIFPNPAKDFLYIQASSENEKGIMQIIDASGRKLKEIKITLDGNNSWSVDIRNLPKGI
ncbi:MAG: T9SS type A sorting domain-containing protein, partial [Bacteroidota bacterium]|nr:T9SS type A sorting domain-containing protein [Bacteroidota bacterium]